MTITVGRPTATPLLPTCRSCLPLQLLRGCCDGGNCGTPSVDSESQPGPIEINCCVAGTQPCRTYRPGGTAALAEGAVILLLLLAAV